MTHTFPSPCRPARAFALALGVCIATAAVAADNNTATGNKPSPASAAPAKAVKAEGTWKWTFTMPDGTRASLRAKLKRDEQVLTGTSEAGPGSEIAITDGRVDGDRMSWKVVREHAGQRVTTRYSATISGDSAKGTIESDWSGEMQSYPWEPRRVSDSPEGTWRWEFAFGRPGGGPPGRGGGPGGGDTGAGPGRTGGGGGGGGGGGRGGGFRLESRATFKFVDGNLTGSVTNRGTESPIINAAFKDGKISFEIERERSDGTITVTKYSGKLDGDTIKGRMEFEVRDEMMKVAWEATRIEEQEKPAAKPAP